MPDAVFIRHAEGRFTATELARGPWDPQAQHGGAPAGLLLRAFEHLPASEGLLIARVSYEFMRPAPLGELQVQAEVTRAGRRVQLLEGSLRGPDGSEIVRARGLMVRRADEGIAESPGDSPPRLPEAGDTDVPAIAEEGAASFGGEAMEIRFASGSFNQPGPAMAWFRLRVPLVDGEEPSPLQRLATAADFGNGISAAVSWEEWMFINPDLTLYVNRPPVGEWICLDAQTTISPAGVGTAESTLYDQRGPVGRATQALLIARR